MPFDRRHVVLQWGGTLPGGEIWSNSLRLASSGEGPTAAVPTHDDMITWLNTTVKDALAAYHGGTTAGVHQFAKLVYAKLNVVDQNGHYVEDTTNEYVWSPTLAGGNGGTLHPNQIALVVTLATDFERGHAHQGRYYMPLPAFAVASSDGLISTSDANFAANAAKQLVEALSVDPAQVVLPVENMRVCVMSQRGTGATRPVTGIKVGRVLDTQRRRRQELPESYVRVTVAQH